MKCKKLFQIIEKQYPSYIPVWEDICNIESPTCCKEGVDAVGQYISNLAASHGWKVEKYPQPVSGDVICITMNPHSSNAPISLSGHMDTVHPIGSFGVPAVRMDEEKIYGPGVVDCKGGIVAALLAMDALQEIGFTDRPIQLLLQSDEENSSMSSNKDTIGYICKKAENSIAFLNLEGAVRGKAGLVRKGIISYCFAVHGIAAHAAHCATAGASAIAEAAHKIIELEKLKDDAGLTCTCGTICGGTADNAVPDICTFSANIRFATQEQLEWVKAYVQNVADRVWIPGCICDVSLTSYRVAMEYQQRNANLLETMNRIFSENGLSTLEKTARAGGSDAADITAYGIPCVDNLGPCGDSLHSPKEYCWLHSLKESAMRIAAVVFCI